uniref:Post-transcriptional regulator n=1 Tax=Parastrongyloides trichosuri TaxID=131310 RepID=A0A0N4ZET0_PARTI
MSKDQKTPKKEKKKSKNDQSDNTEKSEKDNTKKASETTTKKTSDDKDTVEKKTKKPIPMEEYLKLRKQIYDKLRLSELGWRLHENSQYSRSRLKKLFYSGDDNALDYKFCLEFSGNDPWATFDEARDYDLKSNDI